MKKVYYAHYMGDYNTDQEKKDVEDLEKMGFDVVNPNTANHSKNYKQSELGMEYFLKIVRGCDVVAFRVATKNKKISSGVAMELREAEKNNIPIIELQPDITDRAMSYQDTLKMLGR